MTVSTTYEPVQYNGNSVTTVFAFPYSFFEDTDLLVTLTLISNGANTTQVLNTDYTVTGGNGDDGSITFLSAPATGYRVTIELALPYTQEDDYVENQAFPAETLESGLDKAAIRDQQLRASIDSSLKFPATLAGSYVGTLPAPVDGQILAWDGVTGDVQNISIGDLGLTVPTTLISLASGDFLVYSGTVFQNRTLAYVQALFGLGTSAYLTTEEVRQIPQNSQSAAYTLVLTDQGKHIFHPSADTTARIWTIPANSSVAFPIGTAITFVNQNAAGVITIAITSDTMRLAGAGTTGSRTLAANGIATALKVTSTEWIISGTGLT